MSQTTRCTPEERAKFKKFSPNLGCYGDEPALGTLDERLGILIRRFGGRTKPLPRLTAAEREQYRS